MIQLENVLKQFGATVAVSNISLTVTAGEIFGLVGPDGAGKTTAIRLMTGVLRADAGRIVIVNSDDIEATKGDIGYVPQKFSLYGDLTVFENIRVIGSLYGKTAREIETLATEILSFTKLLPFKDRLADNLSGGMKQKLALAAGLMHKPKLFFLDEPTTGVDPVSRREFWHMLYRLNKEGMTVFVSTPYMDEAELCTRVAFMHHGKIVSCASPSALRASYPYKILELHVANKTVKQHLSGLVLDANAFGDKFHLVVTNPSEAIAAIRQRLAAAGMDMISLKEITPTLEDVFVNLAGEVS
jgi:ABC-2 type transport system ATP-binding protein